MTTASSLRVATPELVQQLVVEVSEEAAVSIHPLPLVIGARARPTWPHGTLAAAGGSIIEVAACATPLAARQAIAEFAEVAQENPDAVLVVLTDLPDTALGSDVLGRFVRPRLFSLNVWDTVMHRFGVRSLDPAFSDSRYSWMAEPLLEVPTLSVQQGVGTLSVDAGLRAVSEHLLGATGITIERLLVASRQSDFADRVALADPNVMASLCGALADLLGPAGQLVLGAIVSGHGELALPAGLASRTLVGGISGSFAQAKIQTLTGVDLPTDAALGAWARSAELAFEELDASNDPVADDVSQIGSALVTEWQAPFPSASGVLSASFEARLELLANQLEAMLNTKKAADSKALRSSVQQVAVHRDATSDFGKARAQRAQLAARLVSWLRDPVSERHGTGMTVDGSPLSLAASIAAYQEDGSWVDTARRRVSEGDDTPAELAQVLRKISEQAHARRAEGNMSFAQALARWTVNGAAAELNGTSVVAVESVLGQVVAPLAAKTPVLFVVLDGCGLPAFLEFFDQFRRIGLHEIGTGGHRRSALAALPTVTQASRTSLLSGKLCIGASADEKRNLPLHPAVKKLGGKPAVLFHHHPDLVSGIGLSLPGPVTDALGAGGPSLVAAVVNTIDDELSHGTFTAEYRLENMGPLSALLRSAVDAGRVVIVTADHGHVLGVGLDGKGQAAISGDGGARWRVADREPTQDEVLLRGPRVLLGDERGILAPWHDDLRYSAKSGGYHGGATPDECLVPLAVFAPTGVNPPDGWELVAVPQPAWWDLQIEVVEAETQRSTPKRRKAAQAPDPGQQLFPVDIPPTEEPALAAGGQAAPVGAVAPWADRLLASEIYAVQLGALSRAKPKEENVRATLGALYGRGGLVNFGVVAQVTGLAPGRVPGFLAMLARLLNVDGFGVLTVDSAAQEARLDEQLLLDQFLDGGAA